VIEQPAEIVDGELVLGEGHGVDVLRRPGALAPASARTAAAVGAGVVAGARGAVAAGRAACGGADAAGAAVPGGSMLSPVHVTSPLAVRAQ